MKRLPQKQIERRILERFLETQPQLQPRNIHESESPDFILDTADYTIGVEITGIHDEQRQKLISDWLKIACLCEKEISTRKLPVVFAHIMFNEHLPPRKAGVPIIARQVADCIGASVPADQESVTVRRQRHPNGGLLPREIAFVSVSRFDHLGGTSSVNIMDGGFSRLLTKEIIKQRLDGKSGRLPVYRKKCQKIWLVIAYELGGIASLFKLEDGLLTTTFTGGFDRVFLFNGFTKRTYELQVG